MDKFLKPSRFDGKPDSPTAAKEWTHWLKTFQNFVDVSREPLSDEDKFKVITNFLSYDVYELVSDCTSYTDIVDTLNSVFIKKKSEIYARHILAVRKQLSTESIDQYVQALKILSKDCDFKAVTAADHKNQYIRDTFINGLLSTQIRQRLLENDTLGLDDAINQALALEAARKQAEGYIQPLSSYSSASCAPVSSREAAPAQETDTSLCAIPKFSKSGDKCYFCGLDKHPRPKCPARDAECRKCGIKGHYAKACRKSASTKVSASIIATINKEHLNLLSRAVILVKINDIPARCLIDTGSSASFIDHNFTLKHKIPFSPGKGRVSMASTSLSSAIEGHVLVNLKLNKYCYPSCKLTVMKGLCAEVLIGHDILMEHSDVSLSFGGSKPPLTICAATCAFVESPRLFSNLSADCKPIATKSRRYTEADLTFIGDEVSKLLSEGVIEESNSPWRAQVLVTESERQRKRMVIDYSQTVNKFTLLDAYPLPNIDDLIRKVAAHKIFSTIDLRSAYHQVPILEEEKLFTAFEAAGKLYQFTRIPFGVTNGVACFQRVIDKVIAQEKLTGVFSYLDDITVCGQDNNDHDKNLSRLLAALEKHNLKINKSKSKFNLTSIRLLGHLVSHNDIRPDPERLKPLLEMPPPHNAASLKRVLGLFAHYSKWITHYSDKIRSLTDCKSFPLDHQPNQDFENLKLNIADAAVTTINDTEQMVVETDASDVALAATLSQAGRPVAFFSRTLTKSERAHPAIEKEAAAIVESLKRWRSFLLGKKFQLLTDQQALSFVFNQKHSSKIKNDKILRWRLELAPFQFDITYRPGRENIKADALSRVCSSVSNDRLLGLHESLNHPGITRMIHWLRCKNLPFSVEDVRRVNSACPVCAEVKPRFLKSRGTLIKATAPFERINIDFKGPIPSKTRNYYILTIIDEYSRFPFAYACKDITSATVIKCLTNLFMLFGTPAYVHSDRGSSFISRELLSFLHSNGIASSHSTPYNPQGNGQVERLNGTLWKTINLALKTKNLQTRDWEEVLQEALHSIRSLLCTATNCTPHERFFSFPRRTSNGEALPTWLTTPGPVLIKRNVRSSKYDDLVEEAELLEANPQYAFIRRKDGSESTVSLRQLAPKGDTDLLLRAETSPLIEEQSKGSQNQPSLDEVDAGPPSTLEKNNTSPLNVNQPVQSDPPPSPVTGTSRTRRTTKPPAYLKDYVTNFSSEYRGGECDELE